MGCEEPSKLSLCTPEAGNAGEKRSTKSTPPQSMSMALLCVFATIVTIYFPSNTA